MLAVNGFSWSSCSKDGDPSNLTSLSVSPDPIKLPGNVTLAFSGNLNVNLASPLAVSRLAGFSFARVLLDITVI